MKTYYLPALLVVWTLLGACNTFADPDAEQMMGDAGAGDAAMLDAGSDAANDDAGSDGSDAFDVGNTDTGEDADMSVPEDMGTDMGGQTDPDFTVNSTGLPSVMLSNLSPTMEECGNGSYEFPGRSGASPQPDITTVVVEGGVDERFALTWIDDNRNLRIGHVVGDQIESLFTSSYVVAERMTGKNIAVASIGATWLVGAIDGMGRINLVLCTFAGEPACTPSFGTNIMANHLEIGRTSSEYFLYVPTAMATDEYRVMTEGAFSVSQVGPLPGGAGATFLHRGVLGFSTGVIGFINNADELQLVEQDNMTWRPVTVPETVTITEAEPRIDFLPKDRQVWWLANSATGVDVDAFEIITMVWTGPQNVLDGVTDYSVQTVAGGSFRSVVDSNGNISLSLHLPGGTATTNTVRDLTDNDLVVGRPTRAAIANGQPAIVRLLSGRLYLIPLCTRAQ